jgi:ATP-dependent protease ClpP protease subunit
VELISMDVDRDYFMSAQQAADYGLIDKVMERR